MGVQISIQTDILLSTSYLYLERLCHWSYELSHSLLPGLRNNKQFVRRKKLQLLSIKTLFFLFLKLSCGGRAGHWARMLVPCVVLGWLSMLSSQPPPLRPRASSVRRMVAATVPPLTPPGPGLEVECAVRRVAFDAAMRTPTAKRHAAAIATSLDVGSCPVEFHDMDAGALLSLESRAARTLMTVGKVSHAPAASESNSATFIYLDCGEGDDHGAGTAAAPLKTVAAAQLASRAAGPGSTV